MCAAGLIEPLTLKADLVAYRDGNLAKHTPKFVGASPCRRGYSGDLASASPPMTSVGVSDEVGFVVPVADEDRSIGSAV